MAANLTRDWIQYLKNNQIAALQSDPKTGSINYKRPVTASDVIYFLQNSTDYDDDQINAAIDRVAGAQTTQDHSVPATQTPPPSTANNADNATAAPNNTTPNSTSKKYDTSNATDVEPRYGPKVALPGGRRGLPAPAEQPAEPQGAAKRTGGKVAGQISQTPNAIRKRQARANRKAALTEDFKDDPGPQLSEKQIEEIFKILSKGSSASSGKDQSGRSSASQTDPQEVRADEINKIKKLIFTTMTVDQRKQLWDELKGATLSEAIIKKYEAEEVLKGIVNQNKTNYRQSKITMDQLKDAWQKAGYPLDTNEIGNMLRSLGYSDESIDQTFNSVLGDVDGAGDEDDDSNDTESRQKSTSQAVTKIAAYIQKAGLTSEIVQFMQENFAEELQPKQSMWQKAKSIGKNFFSKKPTNEDVKKIFTLMLDENINIIRRVENARLGRNKK